jgi:hypothetical protein
VPLPLKQQQQISPRLRQGHADADSSGSLAPSAVCVLESIVFVGCTRGLLLCLEPQRAEWGAYVDLRRARWQLDFVCALQVCDRCVTSVRS